MSYDQHSPGADIIDLRDVAAERDRIVTSIVDALADRDEDAIKENEDDPRGDDRCTNGCVCTLTEKIDNGVIEPGSAEFIEAIENDDALLEAAEVTYDDIEYLIAVNDMVAELNDDLDSAADNEPIMVNDDYFVAYAEQLADDIGAIDRNLTWPLSHIDWQAAADELKQDYTDVTFGGRTYWWRAY